MLSYNTLRAIPYLPDYDAAARWERDTKPIRGDADATKPLGNRRQKYIGIKREADGAIAIIYVRTPIVRYFPDDTMAIYSTMYPQASTQEIISEVTGLHLYTDARKTWVRHAGGETPLLERKRRDVEVPNFFRWSKAASQWVCTNPPELTTHVVNRKRANAVRARYAEALKYIEALDKLMDTKPKQDEVLAAFEDVIPEQARLHWWQWREYLPDMNTKRFSHKHAADFIKLLESPEPGEQYKAYLWTTIGGNKARPAAERALMMQYRDEWFDEAEVPAGKKAIDRYEWAFKVQD